jgi:pimeloyl-ACP methyl ester carboxylesterase
MTALTQRQASDLFRADPDRHVDVGNGEVAVRSVGTGPDVLFVHGWPVSGATWRGLLPHLAPHVRCHVVDLVGAGSSRFDRTVRLGIDEHADAVRRVVDALGLDDVAVVGHDSGGLIARTALAGDPRVRAWGLVDTEQPQGATLRFRMFIAMRYLPRFEHLVAALLNAERLRRNRLVIGDCFDDRTLLDGEFAEFFLRPLRDDPDRRWAAGQFGSNFDLGAFGRIAAMHSRIEVPVQLVWGGKDPFFPVAWTREMMAGFGGPVSLHVVERGRLFHHEEFPEEVSRALLPTLTG